MTTQPSEALTLTGTRTRRGAAGGVSRVDLPDRHDRFIAAAFDLLGEVGSDFSVREVVDRSRLSLRSFYQSFEGKSDLFLAMYREAMGSGLARQMAAVGAAGEQPLDRLRAFFEAEWRSTAEAPAEVSRALATYQQRLAESRPAELAEVLRPQHCALTALLRSCRESGADMPDLSDEQLASQLTHLLMTTVQASIFGFLVGDLPCTEAHMWSLVAAAMGHRAS